MSFYLYNEFPEVIEDPDRTSIFYVCLTYYYKDKKMLKTY